MWSDTSLVCEVTVKNTHLLDVWHKDPKGDQGLPCGDRKYWRWHLHHIDHITVPVVRQWYRKRFLRCSWCGGGWTRVNPVNLSTGQYGNSGETVHLRGDCLDNYMRLEHLRRKKNENI